MAWLNEPSRLLSVVPCVTWCTSSYIGQAALRTISGTLHLIMQWAYGITYLDLEVDSVPLNSLCILSSHTMISSLMHECGDVLYTYWIPLSRMGNGCPRGLQSHISGCMWDLHHLILRRWPIYWALKQATFQHSITSYMKSSLAPSKGP